jgi:choline dehydrogenase
VLAVSAEYDYIVVGAGAGGGPLACNLALAPEGFRVALIEAGSDPCAILGSPEYFNYSIPALHACASEDPGMSWAFFVKHYTDPKRQQQDPKYVKDRGIFYPRAAAIGGCTAHHAMITVYPHHDDWRRLADLTGDASWSPENMRQYFERLEECRYVPQAPGATRDPTTRHGLAGWLPVSMPDPTLALGDPQLLSILLKAFLVASVAADRPEVLTTLADVKARAALENRARSALALGQAVDQLVARARRETGQLSDDLRSRVAALAGEVGRLKGEAEAAADVLGRYADSPDLLELFRLAYAQLDTNRWFDHDADRHGPFNTPSSILHGVRSGVRERVLAVRALYPDRLILIPEALVTEVVIEQGRAVGVRYVQGRHLYRAADGAPSKGDLPPRREARVRARGEVILAGGAFNTPQLLMLSGVGASKDLDKLKIRVACPLPGVGKNLQDRYEVGLVSELDTEFHVLEGSKFQAPEGGDDPGDRALQEWMNHRGVYATNGVVLSIIRRSSQAEGDVPDLYLFGVPGYFRGYVPGFCREAQNELKDRKWVPNHRRFTWAVLKGRTRNRAGTVSLRTTDPRDPPDVHFRYFDEGSGDWRKDLDAVVEGVRFADQIMRATGLKRTTLVPKDVDLADTQGLRAFIQHNAWGHHACGTCKIGKDGDSDAVLDCDFRVRGVENLRVVDASVFPEIPGFFILVPIYMVSEKASDVILADHRRSQPRAWARPVRG